VIQFIYKSFTDAGKHSIRCNVNGLTFSSFAWCVGSE